MRDGVANDRLGLKIHAAQEALEARVGAQRIENGVCFEASYRALVEGLFQPFKGLVLFTKTRIDRRHIPSGDVLFLRQLNQLVENLPRLWRSPCGRIRVSEARLRLRVVRVDRQLGLKLF